MTELVRTLVRSFHGPLPVLVKLRQDHETPIAARIPNHQGPRICKVCGGEIQKRGTKYARDTCSDKCGAVYVGQLRSARVANRGVAEKLAIALGVRARKTELKAQSVQARVRAGLCRRCGEPRAPHSDAHCQVCLDAIAMRRRQIVADGRCRECKQPRGESPSDHYCAICLQIHNDRGYRGAPRKWTRPRKRTPEMEPIKRVMAKVPASLAARLDSFAARYDMTLSLVIREALDCYMDSTEHEEPDMPTRTV